MTTPNQRCAELSAYQPATVGRNLDFVQMVPRSGRKRNAVCPVLREMVHQLTRGEAVEHGNPMFQSQCYTPMKASLSLVYGSDR